MRDLDTAHERGLWWDAEMVIDIALFFSALPHSKGQWGGTRLHLEGWQIFILGCLFGWKRADGTRRFRYAYVEVPRKNGKLLALDTPIPTPHGWTTQGELRVGDVVFNHEGHPTRVVWLSDIEEPVTYRMEFSDGVVIFAGAKHEWYTEARVTGRRSQAITVGETTRTIGDWAKTSGIPPSTIWNRIHVLGWSEREAVAVSAEAGKAMRRRWQHADPRGAQVRAGRARRVPSDDIRTTEQIADTLRVERSARRDLVEWNHRIPLTGPLALPEVSLPIPPYSLGVWLGDGSRGSSAVTKRTAQDAAVIMPRVRSEGIEVTGGAGGLWRFTGLAARLRALGIIQEKGIPAVYLRASIEQRLALLAGLMDTDGHCTAAGQCEFSTTAPGLRDGMIELLRSLGYKPGLSTTRARYAGRDYGEAYRVGFWPYVGDPMFTLPRKLARLKPRPARPTRAAVRQIVGAEIVPSVPMRCIQIEDPRGLYLAGEGMVPTHNSTMAAGVGLYLAFEDGEPGAEVYSIATKREQAKVVWTEAKRMVLGTPKLRERITVLGGKSPGSMGNLSDHTTHSKFEPLGSDAPNLDGLNVHGLISDEMHAQLQAMIGVMESAVGARAQPLTFGITTAGSNRAGACYDDRSYLVKILEGVLQDAATEATFGIIFTIDADDDWGDPRAWAKANPNLGVSINRSEFAEAALKAKETPARRATFLTKRLDVWVNADSPFFDMTLWMRAAQPFDLADVAGVPCWLGVDLASKSDLAAVIAVFVDGGRVRLRTRFYLPRQMVLDGAHAETAHYAGWATSGHLTLTEGNLIDFAVIREDIKALAGQVAIREIGYDPFQATQIVTELSAAGLTLVEIPQTVKSLNGPMKAIRDLLRDGRLEHDGNPVMAWCISNVVAHEDANENVFPRKASRNLKIDGATALFTGYARPAVQPAVLAPSITVLG